MSHKLSRMFDRELKKGSAELLILSLIEHTPRHGYDIAQLIEARSDGVIQFKVASLYPLLYKMEHRGWIVGRWIERAGTRASSGTWRRMYGRAILREQRKSWRQFAAAISSVAGVRHA